MTLLSLASRQIWPQVLGVLHCRPHALVLFHTDEESESKGPAERLAALFPMASVLPAAAIQLVRIPHNRYGEIRDSLADTAGKRALDGNNCLLNVTGGNKLMVLAALEWARLVEVPVFYLERGFRVFPLRPQGGELVPEPDFSLDTHLARSLEPLELLRCQLDGAEVESPGQRLTLSEEGQHAPLSEYQPLITQGHDFREFLSWDNPETESMPGFGLEFAAAAVLLRLGVPVVQRSIELRSKSPWALGRLEGELDLVFNWAGKLWVVDCKDKVSGESKVQKLRNVFLSYIPAARQAELIRLLDNVEDELRDRELKPLKEDLLAVAEVGGLLGRALCIRKSPLPPEAEAFARSRKLTVLLKDRLVKGLQTELFPDCPAGLADLQSLARARTRASA